MNLTRERVRQLELSALAKMGIGVADLADPPRRRRRLPLLEEDPVAAAAPDGTFEDAGDVREDFDVEAFVSLEDGPEAA
jgi:hypothetical protein